jgi:hypothetical protein
MTGDENMQAAALAAAILRFQEPLAHQSAGATPEGMPVVGVDACVFSPASSPVPRRDVAAYLAGLPGPAWIAATVMRGAYSVLLLDELAGDRRASMQRELDNQREGLASLATGPGTDRVLLEFDAEVHLFSLAAVRRWAERYLLTTGWNIQRCPEPDRAEWRLNLFGGDGRRYSRGAGP